MSPPPYGLARLGELIVMVVLGGIGHPVGAVIGAVVVTLLDESLGHLTEHWRLGLGLVIILVALLRDADLKSLLRGGSR